jgi:hypothetical protein
MQLLDALRIETEALTSEFKKSGLFTHMGNRGAFREEIIHRFLRPFLPPCYGIGSGEVFSSDGQQSAQIDIVLYDAVFSTVYQAGSKRVFPHSLFPAESIYGSIEVKSSLTIHELNVACENIASVKRLGRAPADALDILPHYRLALAPDLRLTFPDLRANPYLGFIFGFKGAAAERVLVKLNERIKAAKQNLPDFIFVADPGYMVVRTKADGSPAHLGMELENYRSVETGAYTMACLFLMLNSCIGSLRLRRFSTDEVWSQIAPTVGSKSISPPRRGKRQR